MLLQEQKKVKDICRDYALNIQPSIVPYLSKNKHSMRKFAIILKIYTFTYSTKYAMNISLSYGGIP
jgi:DNA phosphorothioation-dependent restriction protein DptG